MDSTDRLSLLAFDLGAESGRAMLGHYDGQRLDLEEIHRFSNGPVRVANSIHWDILSLWTEIKNGLSKSSHAYPNLAGLGLDTWGVDFGLLASDDSLLGNPYHYRDHRTDGMMETAFTKVSREEIYEATGIQFMVINSIYQLFSMVQKDSPVLSAANTLLMMPDLFNFWFTGEKASEFTIATTSQCYNPRTCDWSWGLLERLNIPTHLFQPVVQPGTVLGPLLRSVADETDSHTIPVVAPACHDTGCAVAAVPATDRDYIYISSGTWSLMGVEIEQPIITPESLACDITNEGGVNGTFRFLKNIMGMWLLQECRREWARAGRNYSYDDLTHLAEQALPFGSLIMPSDPLFLAPGGMPSRIQAFCSKTGQAAPEGEGAITRCILESLAMEYRWLAERLESLRGRRMETIHIIGGGSRNKLLNQFTADATHRTVVAGPVEATAIGNVLIQAIALGAIGSLEEGRAIVRRSFDVSAYEPGDTSPWDAAYERYLTLKSGGPGNV